MTAVQWARLHSAARCGLRLGAWYRVTALSAREVHLRVHGRLITVPRQLIELRAVPPDAWTVVRAPLPAGRAAAGVSDGYLVCPNCRYRDPLPATPVSTRRCARCNEAFPVAWNESYLPPAAATRGRGRHMTRRRLTDRRRGVERRTAERRMVVVAVRVERRSGERRRTPDRRSGRERRSGTDRRHRGFIL